MTPEDKQCAACGEHKSVEAFYRDARAKDGLYSSCRVCTNKRSNHYRKTNPIIIKVIRSRAWKKYSLNNKIKIAESNRRRRQNNPEKIKLAIRQWGIANPDKLRELRRRSKTKKRSTPRGKLQLNMATSIWQSIKWAKSNRHWEDLIGYTVDQLKTHLEKLFKPGMTWGNYGLWHIDHKIPISAFNYEIPEDIDFKKAWALDNLQPLWATENQTKYNKLDKPFQPSLHIGG